MSGSAGTDRSTPPPRRSASALRRLAAVRPSRKTLTGTRLNRILLVTALAVGATAFAFGTGYRSSRAAFDDGGAYLQKSSRVVHVNADNRDIDARTAKQLATGKQTLEVVQVGPELVYVVNNETGVVTRLPTESLEAEPVQRRPDSKGKLSVVTGGGSTYLVDAEQGTLNRLERKDGPGAPVPAPRVTKAVVDGNGTAWAYAPESGELVQISGGTVTGKQRVTGSGEQVGLTLVSGAPVLYRPETGQASLYGPDGLRRQLDLDARYGISSAPGAPNHLAVVVPNSGELVIADFGSGEVKRMTLPDRAGHQFGPPVVLGGRVYVPDFTSRHVLVVPVNELRVATYTTVPGTSATFEVSVRDSRVWINDPHGSGIVVSFDGNGRSTEIDITGRGDDPPKPAPSKSATPPPPTRTPKTPPPKPAELLTVPDLVGLDRTAACAQLEPKLRCVAVAQPDGEGETDKVLSTNPPAGSRLSAGKPVTVVYRGPARVPRVVDLPAGQACQALIAARLKCVDRVSGLASSGNEVRVVTAQNPAPDSAADTDAPVEITYPAQIAVGNFAGQPYDTACPVGLNCVPRNLGPGTPAYVVVAQTPAAGAGADPGSNVVLDHYGHPAVPALVGMNPDQACATLQAAQLACNRNDNAVTLQVNQVLAQDPAPGAALPAGSPVTITYESTAPAPLHRFKAPAPNRANFLSPGGGGPGGWSQQSTIGRVYPPDAAVPGLQNIYQSRCVSGCGEVGGYYYSGNPQVQQNWVMEGAAFACFTDSPPGTVPLHALMHGADAVWVFAEPGSAEYQYFKDNGFGRFEFRICNVWPRP
ncbi:PASTA domain, binds beta-lactams [Micromonospora pallida]|uniref:PASTA domain, binds beta-lactams n=1 Tax=Micromonospora pallida TaxID=145854 RepID=A0A1C6T6K4_9ACTN|nr:PASTA domain-containing protein [Micromonospora pallida]SCL37075.1 PASTA domain, binds beta-lactams [Micromonospora pallida]